jgi:molybdopterin-guanine dinucleotide biosynthesis protein A
MYFFPLSLPLYFLILVDVMDQEQKHPIPALKGLVLAGGESRRMGFDKSLMNYHGLPQREYLFHLLQPYTTETFISCRPGQIIESDFPLIEDEYEDMGPFGAILTAFKKDPSAAWFVVACDFPLLDHHAILQLKESRNTGGYATSFLDIHTLMPEPWITILEPKIYPVLLEYHSRGKSSLRGILVDYNTTVIKPEDPDILLNANTKEEAERLKQRIDGD